MKKFWSALILIGIIFAFLSGNPEIVTNVVLKDLQYSVELILSLISVIAFWSGLMRIVEKSGILNKFAKMLSPLIKLLFNDIKDDSRALNAVIMTIAANMFGVGNAATGLGIRAMQEMQKSNRFKNKATNSMCMFLIINVSSIQIIPLTVIKLRSDAGAFDPTDVVIPTLIATTFSTIVAVLLAKYYERKNI
jgi:spore maturation protein A